MDVDMDIELEASKEYYMNHRPSMMVYCLFIFSNFTLFELIIAIFFEIDFYYASEMI